MKASYTLMASRIPTLIINSATPRPTPIWRGLPRRIPGFGLQIGSSLEHQSLKACPQLIRTGSPWNSGEGPASSNDYSLPQAIL